MTAERGFPDSEFESRTTRAQAAMKAAELDLLWLTTEADIRYFTGFLTQFWESPTRPWHVLIPVSGKPVAVIPAIGAALMRSTWIDDIRTWPAPVPRDDGEHLLADTMAELAPPNGRIGTPCGMETWVRWPLDHLRRLEAAIGRRKITSDEGLTARLRAIKSEAEIDKIRTACAIANRAFARVPDIARAGLPLTEVFRRFQIAALEEGADRVAYLAGGAGPDGYADVISPATEAPLAAGDILMLDTGVVFDGYFADFDRNWSIGPNSATTGTAQVKLHGATDAALACARPGVTAADLYHAMSAELGTRPEGRLGHGLGMQLTEGLSLIPDDHTPLEPGMVITLEPWIETAPGRIMVHEEDIVIRDSGPELLSARAPQALPVI